MAPPPCPRPQHDPKHRPKPQASHTTLEIIEGLDLRAAPLPVAVTVCNDENMYSITTRGAVRQPRIMIGAIGGGEWCESCARGLRPAVKSCASPIWWARKVSATDHMADDDTHFPRPPSGLSVGAGGPLKSALELRLRPREEGRPSLRRLFGMLSGRGGRQ